MRRLMMQISEKIAEKYECQALITGESLGQVASQTIGALSCTNEATDLLVFRPLIGMDKQEIIDIATKLTPTIYQLSRMRTAVPCLHQSIPVQDLFSNM